MRMNSRLGMRSALAATLMLAPMAALAGPGHTPKHMVAVTQQVNHPKPQLSQQTTPQLPPGGISPPSGLRPGQQQTQQQIPSAGGKGTKGPLKYICPDSALGDQESEAPCSATQGLDGDGGGH
jgi:hypothetical protein